MLLGQRTRVSLRYLELSSAIGVSPEKGQSCADQKPCAPDDQENAKPAGIPTYILRKPDLSLSHVHRRVRHKVLNPSTTRISLLRGKSHTGVGRHDQDAAHDNM